MIVCHCKGLTDRDIRRALSDGAINSSDVSRICSAGTDCGGCRPLIDRIVKRDPPRAQPAQQPA